MFALINVPDHWVHPWFRFRVIGKVRHTLIFKFIERVSGKLTESNSLHLSEV